MNDLHSLVQLLKRNGIPYADEVENSPPDLPKFEAIGSIEKLIAGIEPAVKAGTNRSVGFVLDADAKRIDRWRQVHHRLSNVEVPAAVNHPPAEGFIGETTKYKTRVGVWLMPDNERDGSLEDFLRTLISDGDPLIGHAQKATEDARTLGAKFSILHTNKAVVHSWLAWQDKPGKPYGLAMKAEYFLHDSPTAAKFVAWFKALYWLGEIPDAAPSEPS